MQIKKKRKTNRKWIKKKKKTNATEDPCRVVLMILFSLKKVIYLKLLYSNLLYNYFKYNNYRLHLLLCNARWFSVSVTTTILLIIIFIWIYIHTHTHTHRETETIAYKITSILFVRNELQITFVLFVSTDDKNAGSAEQSKAKQC